MTIRRRWHIATLAAAALIVAGCGAEPRQAIECGGVVLA